MKPLGGLIYKNKEGILPHSYEVVVHYLLVPLFWACGKIECGGRNLLQNKITDFMGRNQRKLESPGPLPGIAIDKLKARHERAHIPTTAPSWEQMFNILGSRIHSQRLNECTEVLPIMHFSRILNLFSPITNIKINYMVYISYSVCLWFSVQINNQ